MVKQPVLKMCIENNNSYSGNNSMQEGFAKEDKKKPGSYHGCFTPHSLMLPNP
jgi:hypothetical protein